MLLLCINLHAYYSIALHGKLNKTISYSYALTILQHDQSFPHLNYKGTTPSKMSLTQLT